MAASTSRDPRGAETRAAYVRSSYAVWELTLRCPLACEHCGSRAGSARPDELSTTEALDVVRQLSEVGITEVTLSGGEPFLRRDWPEIARALADRGILCSLITGGLLCRAGCAWTGHAFFNRRGNNPYCHTRALALAKRGVRERVVLLIRAPGRSFDNAHFDIVVEPLDAPWPEGDRLRFTRERVEWPSGFDAWPEPEPRAVLIP
jgi:hypothetical protein